MWGSVRECGRGVEKCEEVCWGVGKGEGKYERRDLGRDIPREAAGSEAPLLTDTDVYLQWTQ